MGGKDPVEGGVGLATDMQKLARETAWGNEGSLCLGSGTGVPDLVGWFAHFYKCGLDKTSLNFSFQAVK